MSDEGDNWGPAMQALPSDRWRAAALAFVEGGGGTTRGGTKGYSEALRRAGSQSEGNALHVQAHQMFHDRRMLDALQELVRDDMKLGAVGAKRAIMEIMQTPDHKDRFNAAKAILDRAGIVEQVEVKRVVEHTMSPEMISKLGRIADSLGVDRRKMLGWRHAPMIDVTPTVVEIPESLRALLPPEELP